MLTIHRHAENHVRIQIVANGKPQAVTATDKPYWTVLTPAGKQIGQAHFIKLDEPGTNLAKGELVIVIDMADDTNPMKQALADADKCILWVNAGRAGVKVFDMKVLDAFQFERSQLFIKDIAVAEMRQDQLLVASSGAMREVQLSDDYIWQKLRAAESEIAHKLRILLTPHQIFPQKPTQDEIDALNGMPYMVETPYDYQPQMFDRDKWGYFVTRQRPIIACQRLRFNLPSQGDQYFDIPLDWLRLDEKYGHVRILPTTNASLVTASVLGFTALTWQSIIPNMLRLTYTAGLKNAAEDYPELIDAIKKMAVVKIITDLFLPQSGSISADGLSESMSTDVGKYLDLVDHIINGDNGNGGLMAMFNGIRAIVI
ncbi:hypothetical protein AH156_19635 [Salmonella enterica subsp. enterica serovar Enteritidis]|nr:hypothetical protein [Salmonella enterica subsp. enterica serovar Enteritidis]